MYGRSSKFMDLFTMLGIIIAIPCIVAYSVFKASYIFALIAVAAVLVGRAFGYVLDRAYDKKK